MPPRPTPKPKPAAPEAVQAALPGPRRLRQGEGVEVMKATAPEYQMVLDAGVFDWIWRWVEAQGVRIDHAAYTNPVVKDLVYRARAEFRAAAHGGGEEPPRRLKRA